MTNIISGLPSNFSVKAAQAQGLIPSNAQVSTINGIAVSKSFPNPTVSNLIGAGLLDPTLPASALGFSGGFGGS